MSEPKRKRRVADRRPRVNPIGPAYMGLIHVLDAQRRRRGISHTDLCARMGIAARSWAKLLNPDTKSGRQPRWPVIEKAFAVLYGPNFRIRVDVEEVIPSALSIRGPHTPQHVTS